MNKTASPLSFVVLFSITAITAITAAGVVGCGNGNQKGATAAATAKAPGRPEAFGTPFKGDISQAIGISDEQFQSGLKTLREIDDATWTRINQKAFLEIRLIKAESSCPVRWAEVVFVRSSDSKQSIIDFLLKQAEATDPEVVRMRAVLEENRMLETEISEKLNVSMGNATSDPIVYQKALKVLRQVDPKEVGIKQYNRILISGSEGFYYDSSSGDNPVIVPFNATVAQMTAHLKKQPDFVPHHE